MIATPESAQVAPPAAVAAAEAAPENAQVVAPAAAPAAEVPAPGLPNWIPRGQGNFGLADSNSIL